MTLAQLNAKIDALPQFPNPLARGLRHDRAEARHLRDTRLGILGCFEGMDPTEDQIAIVHAQLFGEEAQGTLL